MYLNWKRTEERAMNSMPAERGENEGNKAMIITAGFSDSSIIMILIIVLFINGFYYVVFCVYVSELSAHS